MMKMSPKMRTKSSLFLTDIYRRRKRWTKTEVFLAPLNPILNVFMQDPEINRPVLNTQQNINNFQSNKAFLFRLDHYQKGKDSNLDEFIENFKAFQIYTEGKDLFSFPGINCQISGKKHRFL